MNTPHPKTVKMTLNIDADLHRELKITAATCGTTMTALIEQALRVAKGPKRK